MRDLECTISKKKHESPFSIFWSPLYIVTSTISLRTLTATTAIPAATTSTTSTHTDKKNEGEGFAAATLRSSAPTRNARSRKKKKRANKNKEVPPPPKKEISRTCKVRRDWVFCRAPSPSLEWIGTRVRHRSSSSSSSSSSSFSVCFFILLCFFVASLSSSSSSSTLLVRNAFPRGKSRETRSVIGIAANRHLIEWNRIGTGTDFRLHFWDSSAEFCFVCSFLLDPIQQCAILEPMFSIPIGYFREIEKNIRKTKTARVT